MIGLNVNAQHADKKCQSRDTTECNTNNYISVEVDPAPFILGGYSFSLKYSPAKFRHFSLMGSVYRSDFPDKMMSEENYENGFRNLKIKTSYAIFTDYFLRENRTGFYFGPSVFFYNKSVESNTTTEVVNFESVYPNLRVGYVLKPFKNSGFYINPWVNFGKEIITNKNEFFNQNDFVSEDFSYIVAIHLGYRFF